MVVVYTATIWLLGAAFLLFPVLGLPQRFAQVAMTLLVAELSAVMIESYAAPGGFTAEATSTLASQDVPALGLLLYAIAITTGVRAHRARAERTGPPPSVTTRSRSER